MKSVTSVFLLVTMLSLAIAVPPTSTPALQGGTIIVTSTADSGPGTLRQALLDAQSGDTITFDPAVFAPTAPVTISVTSALPHIHESNLTIDASSVGVILDGNNVPGDWEAGLQIVSSKGNTIRGLQISNFSGPGIAISGDAKHNVIGGDRSIGAGPFGQGNLFSHNDMGISLSTKGTSFNTVMGNLIGTDAAGTAALGNHRGVWINEGANGNIVGPDNVIAQNGEFGIVVHDPDSLHNTITQNSIHDNGGRGIALWNDGNAQLAFPLIFNFDLSAGAITGAACSHCSVEIFSDSNDEGAVYEGRATADDKGLFAFAKGTAFVGPYLTATSTDMDGNTSEFSLPTSVSARYLKLQQGNDLSISPFQARCSSELLDNRLGTFWGYVQSVEGWGDASCTPQGIKGLKMVRLSFNEVEDWPSIDWSQPELSITAEQDALVTSLAENGITVTYLLNFWDKANHPQGWPAIPSRFTTEEEIQRYLEYVRFIVGHFKGRVRYFELWNEPDAGSAIQHIKPQDYVELVKRVVPVIRSEDPDAKIVVGSIIFHNPYGQYYLSNLIQSDAMPLVDVVAWHPFFFIGPDYEDEWAYYYAYPAMLREIKQTAIAHGFEGEFRGDEIGWCSPDINDCGAALHMFSNTIAAKYHTRGIVMHLGEDVTVHLGGMSERRRETSAVVSNLATVLAGAGAEPFPIQVQTTVTNVVSYTFSLPNDDHLIALWTDGVAVDEDPGTVATLILPGFAEQKVIGIDVLYGFEQPIITSEEDGNLVIRDLLVKDYSILFRIVSTKNIFLPIVLKGHPR
jgi:hypothetical protein